MRSTRFALAARIAGVLFTALVLTLSTTRDADASPGSDRAADHILLPSAGWDGRPIQAPHQHETVRTATADAPLRGWSAGPVRIGAGFRHAGGSDRVREVQRRLARLGYRVGPIDGLFGRRTRASVGWFQLKHGLPVNGRATLTTVRHLRDRTSAGATGTERTTEPASTAEPGQVTAASRAPAWEAFRQLVGRRAAVPGGHGVQATAPVSRWMLIALLALVVLDALLLIALLRQRRAAVVPTPAPAPAEPVRTEERDAPAAFAAGEGRPSRRFAPPVPVQEERRPGGLPARSREGRP